MQGSSLPPGTSQGRQLIGLQYLRAIAALMVSYFHLLIQVPQYTPLLERYLPTSVRLANGVDLFFVISGFIMLVSSRRSTPRAFAVRRIIRIVPLYWTLTTLLVALALWRPELFRTTVLSLGYFAKSLLFIPYANPGQGGEILPLLVPGWSLNLEMFFYAIFTFVLFAPLRRRAMLTGLIFAGLVIFGHLTRDTLYGRQIGFFCDFRLFEFLFGMVIAHCYLDGRLQLPAWLSSALMAGGFLLLLGGFPLLTLPRGSLPQELLENMLPAAATVLGMVGLEQSRNLRKLSWLAFLGDASYSMYLSHIFVLGAARTLWFKAGLERPFASYAIAFAVFALAAVLIGTILVYRYVELPLQHLFGRRRVADSQIAPAPVSSG